MPAQLAPLLHFYEDVVTQISWQSVKWADHEGPHLFLLEQRREERPTPEVIHVFQDILETEFPQCLHRFAPRHFVALMLSPQRTVDHLVPVRRYLQYNCKYCVTRQYSDYFVYIHF